MRAVITSFLIIGCSIISLAQKPEPMNVHSTLSGKTKELWVDVDELYDWIEMDYKMFEIQKDKLMAYTNALLFLANPSTDPKELAKEKEILEAYRKLQKRKYEPCIKALAQFIHKDNLDFKKKSKNKLDVTEDEFDKIITLIESTDLWSYKRIIHIEILDENNMKVRTGAGDGPLRGGGNIFTLQKKGKNWKIIKKVNWTS